MCCHSRRRGLRAAGVDHHPARGVLGPDRGRRPLRPHASESEPRGAGLRSREHHRVQLSPVDQGYEGDRLRGYLTELQRRVEELPGVEAASLSSGVPSSGGFSFTRIHWAEDQPSSALRVNAEHVSPALFKTLRIPLLRGRGFAGTDTDDGSVLLSASLARQLFGEADPLGRHVSFPVMGEQEKRYQVIGVVGDSRWRELDQEVPLFVYQSYLPERTRVLAVRFSPPTADLIGAVNALAASLDPSMPLHGISSMSDLLKTRLSQPRVFAMLVSWLSALAVTLAAAGLYGVVGYGVEARSREFGIRTALGADRRGIAALAMRQGVLVAIGVLLGGAGGAMAARVVESRPGHAPAGSEPGTSGDGGGDRGSRGRRLSGRAGHLSWLYGVPSWDGPALVAAAGILLGLAGVAGYLPARRAARVDPVAALRHV